MEAEVSGSLPLSLLFPVSLHVSCVNISAVQRLRTNWLEQLIGQNLVTCFQLIGASPLV